MGTQIIGKFFSNAGNIRGYPAQSSPKLVKQTRSPKSNFAPIGRARIKCAKGRMMTEEDILDLVEPRFGSRDLALQWYETRALSGFRGKTAKQVVVRGQASEGAKYVAAIDAGIFA